MSVHPPLRTAALLAIRSRAGIQLALRHVLHEANIIVLGKMSVFLQIRTSMRWHRGKKVFDQLVRNQGMSEVEFGDVGL